ncbi:hypothetical protein TNIN_121921 [Trichonephila inaurata madagascariensis]|uniref:Uncharacterized protein n=1 Tax=Trichonephila inaurata madagascariensis TaxID=2747483 RepID=A0A8X7BQZ0_9ARAC|nr:hypothetical protein TNIN_121921 [Trichonephila inaurata madagascariensis]
MHVTERGKESRQINLPMSPKLSFVKCYSVEIFLVLSIGCQILLAAHEWFLFPCASLKPSEDLLLRPVGSEMSVWSERIKASHKMTSSERVLHCNSIQL